MSGKVSKSAAGFRGFVRHEYSFFIGLALAVIFLGLVTQGLENVAHPYALGAIFVCLLGGVFWSSLSVMRHADAPAIRCGEAYGTLILTLSAICIEMMMITAAMLHGENNPTLARDMMFAVMMIALNG